MRFVAFESGGQAGLGAELADGQLYGLLAGDKGYPGSLDELIGQEDLKSVHAMLSAGRAFSPEQVTFLPPFTRPRKIICVGLNYKAHADESRFEVPDYPVLFARFPSTLVGHRSPLIKPFSSDRFDYEGELAAIIGRGGRRISKADALDHVAGYSIFNDATARDYTAKSHQWMVGKNFDNSGGFGPAFVTADALPAAARGLRISTRINGQAVQDASTSDMLFDLETLIETISEAITLEPGDVIATGTPEGVGAARRPPLYLLPGDACEVEIDGVGLLRNPVAAERQSSSAVPE